MIRARILWPAAIAATLLFYSIPLFHPNVSIHWDLADTTYPAQQQLAQHLNDPRTGAWYPLHWLFAGIGVTPRTMQWELALHALIALTGAYLLARKLFDDATAALIAAPLYSWSGYFAAYSSLLATFEGASLAPWLVWAVLEARLAVIAGVAGLIALTGDVETAAYALALGVLAGAMQRAVWPVIATIVWVPLLAVIPAAATAPPRATLVPSALGTIVNPDHFGIFTGLYSGPGEIRQFYFYGGLLLMPLVIAGVMRKRALPMLAALTLVPLAIAFAVSVKIWFAVALGLALVAGSGAAYVTERTARKRLPIILLCLLAADLYVWNMYRGPLVYARVSYDELYGRRLRGFEARRRAEQAPPEPIPASRLALGAALSGLGLVILASKAVYIRR